MGRELLARVLLFCLGRAHRGGRGGRLRPLRAAVASATSPTARPPRSPTPTCGAVLSREITDRVVLRSEPDLVSAKPLIESAVAGLTGSPPFVALFEDGVRRVHGALLSGDDSRAAARPARHGRARAVGARAPADQRRGPHPGRRRACG